MATPTRLPETPAEIAGVVLDEIEAKPESFNMQYWVALRSDGRLAPDEAPACGTSMCVAGWVAHVTGWTLVFDLDDDPGWDDEDVMRAEKDGRREEICEVARLALGLEEFETFWYSPETEALRRLREIAGRAA